MTSTPSQNTRFKRALIIGASGGIGQALAHALRGDGCDVTALSRQKDGFDLTDPDSAEAHLSALTGPFDLLLVTSGILAPAGTGPEKSLSAVNARHMAEVIAVNAIGPALVLRHAPRLLPRKERAVAAVLTARVGSIGDNQMGGWYSYRASKAAANQITRCAAIELARSHQQAAVIALHPGTVDTPFTGNYPAHAKQTPEDAAAHLLNVLANVHPDQTGQFFDWRGETVPW